MKPLVIDWGILMKLKNVLCIFTLFFLIMACTSESLASNNPKVGNLTIYNMNFSNMSTIPTGVFAASNLNVPYNASFTYNNTLKAIDFNMTYNGYGMICIGGMYPTTDENLTIDVGLNSTSTYSVAKFYNTVADIRVRHMSDNSYCVYSYWTEDNGSTSCSYYNIPPSLVVNNRIPVSILSNNKNRTNIVMSWNSSYEVITPYKQKETRNLPYPVMINPLLVGQLYVNGTNSTDWTCAHIYSVQQMIDRQIVTIYPTKNVAGFGIDGPLKQYNSKGVEYMAKYGYIGTVWADPLANNPTTIKFNKALLSNGWELGIHFSHRLNDLSLQAAENLMDSEYATVTERYGQAPTSWCSLQNADNITHAAYAYKKYGMLWRNGPAGVHLVYVVGNIYNTTWPWWSLASANAVLHPAFTHRTDLDSPSTPNYSIDYSKFTNWVNNYHDASIKITGFKQYYLNGIAQETASVKLIESNNSIVKFTPTFNGYPFIANVKTKFPVNSVLCGNTSIPFTRNKDGATFTVDAKGIYVVSKNTPTKVSSQFFASPASGTFPLKVKFTDKSKGSPASWFWKFGDGTNSTIQNPTHTYNKTGKYTVSLTVKNVAGSSTKTITNYIVVTAPKKPVPTFNVSLTTGKAPLTVKFTDKSINTPTSWLWKFGDGSTSTVQNPSHKYTKVGTYTVSLIVKNTGGSSSITKTKCITVT
jgi:PKD repeat protein